MAKYLNQLLYQTRKSWQTVTSYLDNSNVSYSFVFQQPWKWMGTFLIMQWSAKTVFFLQMKNRKEKKKVCILLKCLCIEKTFLWATKKVFLLKSTRIDQTLDQVRSCYVKSILWIDCRWVAALEISHVYGGLDRPCWNFQQLKVSSP